MTGFDFAVMAILLVSLLFGVWRGLVYEVLSLVGWPVAFVLSKLFAGSVAPMMPGAQETVRVALAYTVVFVAALIAWGVLAWLLSRLVKAVGELNLVILGAVLNFAGMVTIAFSNSSLMLVGGLTLFASGVSITNPLLSTIASQLAKDEQQGAVLGFAQSAGTLGRTIGPSWSGFLFDQLGSTAPFLSGAVAASLSFIVGVSLKLRGKAEPASDREAPAGRAGSQ